MKALCIGINAYAGAPLSGCANDANDWADFFAAEPGVKTGDIAVLLDEGATKKRILSEMTRLLKALAKDEVGYIQFSGHGTWLPDRNGDEIDKKDEALCPYDMAANKLILDDELHKLFADRTSGSRVVFISDCCHSGSMHRFAHAPGQARPFRYISPAEFVTSKRMLKKISELSSVPPSKVGIATSEPVAGVLHFAACLDREYAYDASFYGRANGAFTRTVLDILATPDRPSYSCVDLMKLVRAKLPSVEYPQTPRLNATKTDAKRKFLSL